MMSAFPCSQLPEEFPSALSTKASTKNNIYLKCLDEKGEPIEDLGNAQVFSSLPSLNGLLNEETMVKLKAGTLSKEDLVESIMGSTPLKQISKGIDIRWEDPGSSPLQRSEKPAWFFSVRPHQA